MKINVEAMTTINFLFLFSAKDFASAIHQNLSNMLYLLIKETDLAK